MATISKVTRQKHIAKSLLLSVFVSSIASCASTKTATPRAPKQTKPKRQFFSKTQTSTQKQTITPPTRLHSIDIKVFVAADTEGPDYKAQRLLGAGNDAYELDSFHEAAENYENLLKTFPKSRFATSAAYNAGLAYEQLRQLDKADLAFHKAFNLDPKGVDGRDAALRRAAVLAEQKRWGEADSLLSVLWARQDLSSMHRIEVAARWGYVALSVGDIDRAEKYLTDALAQYRRLTRLEDPYFAAMTHFYWAQVPHKRAMALQFSTVGQAEILARKVKYADEAYVRYRSALVFLSAFWATASGFQMSDIYFDIYKEAMAAEIPTDIGQNELGLYRSQLRARLRPLLEKALAGHRENIGLAEAFGKSTPWSKGSKARVKQISGLLLRAHSPKP